MKKILKESNKKRKEKEFIEFSKILGKKEEEYQRLLKTIPNLKTSDTSTIEKWYEDFISLLFK
jgi:hypothetical protein